MLSDPQSFTYATTPVSLPAISRGADTSVYRAYVAGAEYTMTISHQFRKRNRAVVRLQRDTVVQDILTPANQVSASMACTLTMDFPVSGLTTADVNNLVQALLGFVGTTGLASRIAIGET